MATPALLTVEPAPPLWQWPIRLADYDCSGPLSRAEQRVLTHELAQALTVERNTRAVLDRLRGIERLCIPLDDALAAIHGNGHYDQRVKLMVLKQCALLGSASGRGTPPLGVESSGRRTGLLCGPCTEAALWGRASCADCGGLSAALLQRHPGPG